MSDDIKKQVEERAKKEAEALAAAQKKKFEILRCDGTDPGAKQAKLQADS